MAFFGKIWAKFIRLFKQGLTPKQLAASITVSIAVSFFPIFGIATIVLALLAIKFKLNLPLMIGLSYLVEPVKILLFLPFVNIGANVLHTEHTLLSLEAIQKSYEISFWNTLQDLSYELICGFIGWSVIVLPGAIIFYLILKVLLSFFVKMHNRPRI